MEADHDDIGDHTMIIQDMKYLFKGKRSKRRRPSSALQLTLTLASSTTTSSTSITTTTTDQTGGNGFFQSTPSNIEFTNNILQDTNINNDQDIANCLMLLAHGHHIDIDNDIDIIPPLAVPAHPIIISNTTTTTHHDQSSSSNVIYECKTCDRGFTSFQALGGHRASHNKPHNLINLHHHQLSRSDHPNKPASFSSCAGSTKVHQCSICGSGFTSGQALGGHMRRHRSMTTSTTKTTATTNSNHHYCQQHESKKHKTSSLDLNLPPPPIDDDHHHRKETNISSFGSNNQQIIVFSTPSLVDCHL